MSEFLSQGREDPSTNSHRQTLDQVRENQPDNMLVCLPKGPSVFIEFRLLSPVCVLLKPLFIIVILLSVFVCSGHFLLPQCIEKRVSNCYTVCVMDMGICSFYNNFWGKKSASVIFPALFENLWFCIRIKVNMKQQLQVN